LQKHITSSPRTPRSLTDGAPYEQKGCCLAVWADGYRCFGACHTHGDALDWLMHYRHLSFNEALAVLGEKSTATELPSQRTVRRTPADPPDLIWQNRAERVVTLAEEALWSPVKANPP